MINGENLKNFERGSYKMNHYALAKEEMAFYGCENTSLQNLLAVLIGPEASPQVTGQLAALGIKRVLSMSDEELLSFEGIGKTVVERLRASFGLAELMNKYKIGDEPYVIHSPEDAANYLRDLSILDQEHFEVIFLNTQNIVISRKNVFKGTLNSSIVHPREIFREAVRVSAASIIVSHNHPSGDVQPSREDIEVTKRLVDVGKLVGIEVLDHIIIGHEGKYKSFKEMGDL